MNNSVSLESVSDGQELADLTSRSAVPSDNVAPEVRFDRRLVRAAIENGPVTVEGQTSPIEDDLPVQDRKVLSPLFPRASEDNVEEVVINATTYTAAERNRSVLIPEQDYEMISCEGKRYAITVEHQQIQINTYRYTARRSLIAPLPTPGR
jgi:hypothetical protein